MSVNSRVLKDPGDGARTIGSAPTRRQNQSSDSVAGKGRILLFRSPRNDTDPQGPEPTPNTSCSRRPCAYVLDDFRDNILMAARQGRNYRSIAAQYGVSALEIWRIVTDELAARRQAA